MSLGNIALTGASGFLGRVLMESMQEKGFLFRGFVRNRDESEQRANLQYLPDIRTVNRKNFNECEVVIHAAALAHVQAESYEQSIAHYRDVNVHGTSNMAEAAIQAGVRRIILISSIKACAEFSENGSPLPATVECKPVDPYGVSKREAELCLIELAKKNFFELIILRPTLIYGVGAKGNLRLLMRALDQRKVLPLGSIANNKRSMLSVENACDAIIRAATFPFPKHQKSELPENVRIYHLADERSVSTRQLVELLALGMEIKPRLLSVPRSAAILAALPFGKQASVRRLFDNLEVDINEFTDDFEWKPAIEIEKGILKMATEWHKSGGW